MRERVDGSFTGIVRSWGAVPPPHAVTWWGADKSKVGVGEERTTRSPAKGLLLGSSRVSWSPSAGRHGWHRVCARQRGRHEDVTVSQETF